MIKSDDIKRASRLPVTKASVVALCLIVLIVCSVIGIQILVPSKSGKDQIHQSINPDDAMPLSFARLEETNEVRSESAEELLVGSLILLQDLLIRISEGDDSDTSSKEEFTNSTARKLASDLSSFVSNIASGGEGGLDERLENLSLANLTNSLSEKAVVASKFLGIGLGNGTTTSLKLSPDYVKKSKVLEERPSGANLIAANIGHVISSSLVGSINLDSITPSPETISLAARTIGEGVGNAAAVAVDIIPAHYVVYSNSSDIPAISRDVAQGLTSSFLNGVDVWGLFISSVKTITGNQMNSAAKSMAQGIGSGLAFATRLSTVLPSSDAFNTTGISGIAGNLGQGLSTSFFPHVPFEKLLASDKLKLTPERISDVAKGLGAGLAAGAVVGIGLQPDDIGTSVKLKLGGLGTIVKSFGTGLSQSLLSNETNSIILAVGQQATSKLDKRIAATGVALGFVNGVTESIDNAGGLDNMLSFDPKKKAKAKNLTQPANFDDTADGAAMEFGKGIGLQASILISYFHKLSVAEKYFELIVEESLRELSLLK